MTESRDGDDFVQSLSRGLSVIRAFDADHAALTLSDVAKRAAISPAAARRFLRTLETLGYVRSDGREFELTPRVLELGFSYLSALTLPEVMQPHLEELSRELGESVSAAVLDGADIVYIARVVTRRIMSVRINIGTRFPAYATSMGRVLLAGLDTPEARLTLESSSLVAFTDKTLTSLSALEREVDDVRAQGWSRVDEELELGLRSIAVPVRGRTGMTVAAINISMPATEALSASSEQSLVGRLLATAHRIEGNLPPD